ncbi:Gfo/Idh/MocA family oxidoreductase [Sedimentitalea sp. JM2-8]|uniref:Gfo/Idh/MocA family oxidoreductase n=1 Tax=Sedimentitalea xiamensis TaxID=3050037 RepID=A0ABT7FIE1_9RHOB|nr:Gfo/Idh/MocA family oxidoreductase [Sedimentitalea xiamensis]MDK3074906.1 Gfo/Idh/MocA family oxidoreductase [Sedimentitalea xiamensis]
MTGQIRTAIIGLGIMGRRMLEHMQRHDGFAADFLWDPDASACAQAAELAPGATITKTAEAAIAAADLVYLACPPGPRKAFALSAAQAGKAVFLEKPLGVDVQASADLVAELEASGQPAAVNFTQAAGAALTQVSAAARSGDLGDLVGADIVVTYANWPRDWQKAADWLRFRAEGGMTREVMSHFLFFSERILGPLHLVWARPDYPADPALCETHVAARLETTSGQVVSILGSVGGAQPDRQELTIKGRRKSRRISDFYRDAVSDGGAFAAIGDDPEDPRAASLKAQLDDLVLLCRGEPNRLATPQEALRVQVLVESILRGAP